MLKNLAPGVLLCRTLSRGLTLSPQIANKQQLGSATKSHIYDLTGKTEVIGLSDLMTLFINLGCLYCVQMQRAFIVFKKHTKLIEK
jgi:hypothetical protein